MVKESTGDVRFDHCPFVSSMTYTKHAISVVLLPVGSSRVESGRVQFGRIESSRVRSSRVESSRIKSSRVESGQVQYVGSGRVGR